MEWSLTLGCSILKLKTGLKRVAMILVDEQKSTVACYGGTSKAKTPCCLCRRVF